jgi:WD40 repeat protein
LYPLVARHDVAAARGGRGDMLRLRAFRPTSDKVVKIQLHPTQPWLVTADANDRVAIWNWEHRQVPLAI